VFVEELPTSYNPLKAPLSSSALVAFASVKATFCSISLIAVLLVLLSNTTVA